jgi:hypothetical protein
MRKESDSWKRQQRGKESRQRKLGSKLKKRDLRPKLLLQPLKLKDRDKQHCREQRKRDWRQRQQQLKLED